jgi:hypothetical protein
LSRASPQAPAGRLHYLWRRALSLASGRARKPQPHRSLQPQTREPAHSLAHSKGVRYPAWGGLASGCQSDGLAHLHPRPRPLASPTTHPLAAEPSLASGGVFARLALC